MEGCIKDSKRANKSLAYMFPLQHFPISFLPCRLLSFFSSFALFTKLSPNFYKFICIYLSLPIFRVIPECQAIMDEHQGRKSEIDAREEKIQSVLATGEQMIEKDHFASNEVNIVFLFQN